MPRYPDATLAAIKNAVDIVALVADYGLPSHRIGSKLKAFCPFHDDHNPSLEINPERQSYKCWSCGAGGDVFTFVQEYRDESNSPRRFACWRRGRESPWRRPPPAPEPAGPVEDRPVRRQRLGRGRVRRGPGAVGRGEGLRRAPRPDSARSSARFRLGYAPLTRDWLVTRARRAGFTVDMLEQAGLVAPVARESADPPRAVPGPPALPDPRRQGADRRLRRPNPARTRTKDGRRWAGASLSI